jgi:hypothetical protein
MNLELATTDLMAVSSALTTLGYNGPYQGFKHNSDSKVLLNLIGISMTIINCVIYNFLMHQRQTCSPKCTWFRDLNSNIEFQNSGYQINNKLDSFLLELKG